MRAAACDPMPKVLCGWPRSHLLSSLLAVQRLAGWSRDPSSMACAAAAYTAPCTWPGHAGGGGGCSASKAAYALERSCSTGRGCRITRGWRAEARGSRLARGAPCWPKFGGIKERARVGLARASTGGWEELCACRGVGGDPPGPWPGHRHARITQGRRVGELQPELYFLAVSGQFHELVKRRENRLRASRALLRRGAWSRPTCGQRSARTSLPRRARARHWKWLYYPLEVGGLSVHSFPSSHVKRGKDTHVPCVILEGHTRHTRPELVTRGMRGSKQAGLSA